jgi:hypothetical protein
MTGEKTQSGKFKDAAKEYGADEDEKRWEERLRRVARHAEPEEPAPPRDPVVRKKR